MSRELKRIGPIGMGRSPAGDPRSRRNADTASSSVPVSASVARVDLSHIAVDTSSFASAIPGILARMEELARVQNLVLKNAKQAGQMEGYP